MLFLFGFIGGSRPVRSPEEVRRRGTPSGRAAAQVEDPAGGIAPTRADQTRPAPPLTRDKGAAAGVGSLVFIALPTLELPDGGAAARGGARRTRGGGRGLSFPRRDPGQPGPGSCWERRAGQPVRSRSNAHKVSSPMDSGGQRRAAVDSGGQRRAAGGGHPQATRTSRTSSRTGGRNRGKEGAALGRPPLQRLPANTYSHTRTHSLTHTRYMQMGRSSIQLR